VHAVLGCFLRGDSFSATHVNGGQTDLAYKALLLPDFAGNDSLLISIHLRAVACRLTTGQRGRILAGNEPAKLIKYACSAQGGGELRFLLRIAPTLRRETNGFAPPASRFYFPAAQRQALPARAGL
jgi:hypothetical protein